MPIPELHADAERAAAARQARLTKPAGALGRLESLSVRLAAMTGRIDWLPSAPGCLVCAADHGIAARGVSAYPQSVTRQMVLNFLRGGAAINVLARQLGAQLLVLDAGVIGDFAEHPLLLRAKVAHGTQDFTQGPAMSAAQADAALAAGASAARRLIDAGVNILAVGEMGIGNSSSAAAIIAALTGQPAAHVTGRGTGVDEAALAHKVRLIDAALALHAPAAERTLEKIGGFEIGAIAGAILEAAAARVPVLVDGVISTAAAMIAAQREPRVTDYLIASHRSVEPGHQAALSWLTLQPLLDLNLRLGEGTGALLALPLVEAAMRTLNEMATFDEAGVSDREA